MTTPEYLLNKLPYFLNQKAEVKCPCCNKLTIKDARYELVLEIVPNEKRHRYRLYYRLDSQCYGYPKIIGENCGFGYKTIKEAIKSLLQYKEEIRK